uniref:WhiB family transcriptional regulator n=1 Tax=Micromonospora polyrhachis TaxID=1282883 RepID=UPI0028ACFA50|nr:WhiB family transcriptional regulator [Micromonospora polyrhachis]
MRPQGDDLDWRPNAACAQTDSETFFPVGWGRADRELAEQAKDICRRCPVRDQCLTWAITHRQAHGIWGGLDPDERAAIKRRDTGRAVA